MTSVCVLLLLALVTNVNIRVSGEPSIRSSSSLFIAGENRTLVCYISSTETPTSFPLRWSKDGQQLSASSEETIPLTSGGVTNYNTFYIFMVQPSDNKKVYVCTATFPSGPTASSFEIVVYKGPDTPVISGPSQIVTGQSVSWTCVVDGASSTAPNVYWQFGNGTRLDAGLFTNTGLVYMDTNKLEIHKVTSVLTMTVASGSPSFNLACQATHFETSTQTTANITAIVNFPPMITGRGTNYTVTTGSDVTIVCSITSSPPATSVTWYKDGAVVLMSNSHYAGATTSAPSLIVNGVTKSDTGYYVCSASNSIASANGSANYLNVRYIPIISYSANPVGGVQGSDVTLSCVIDANPTYTTVYWYSVDSNGVDTLIYIQNSAKYSGGTATTTSALTIHNLTSSDAGFYRCVVDNIVGRGRGATLQVQGNYQPEALNFKIGSTSDDNVTVSENDRVTLTCQADAVPVATLTLTGENGGQLKSGQSPLSHVVERARCEDTGQYVCSATNSLGQADNTVTKTLLVRCSPRSTDTNVGTLNFLNTPTTLEFDVTAYPAPSTSFTFAYTGVSGTEVSREVKDVELRAACGVKPGSLNQFTCTVTLMSVTSSHAQGYYIIVVSNSQGLHNYSFQLLYNAPTPQPPDNGGTRVQDNAAAVGGGVAAAVAVVVIVVVVIVIVLKRHRSLKRTPKDYLTPVNSATVSPPSNPERAPPSSSFTDIQMQQAASPVYDPQRPYDQLNMSDVGQRSAYSDLGHQNAGYHSIGLSNHASPGNRGQDDAHPYDDLDDSQIKPNTVQEKVARRTSQPGDD